MAFEYCDLIKKNQGFMTLCKMTFSSKGNQSFHISCIKNRILV